MAEHLQTLSEVYKRLTPQEHDRKRERYRCTRCRKTFSARRGTMLEGLRKPTELIIIVVRLLSYGCPLQAISKGTRVVSNRF